MLQKITTKQGITISKTSKKLDYDCDSSFLIEKLNHQKGVLLSSKTEYPNRYSRWEIGFFNPPVEIIAKKGLVNIQALNEKGCSLIKIISSFIKDNKNYVVKEKNQTQICLKIKPKQKLFTEEERSKQTSSFSVLRDVYDILYNEEDKFLGLYGAFGYDLLFDFCEIDLKLSRKNKEKLFHLYIPDNIYVIDRRKETFLCYEYDFSYMDVTTKNKKTNPFVEYEKEYYETKKKEIKTDISDEKYAKLVEQAKQEMAKGNVFELVLSREFSAPYTQKPSELYEKLSNINPSPYQFLISQGEKHLVGASPEMFVRVTKNKVETCPISGTVKRGNNAIEDEIKIRSLLNSQKDEVELTMCTDVDRNDKSRVCIPESIKLLGRRQIERYKGLFHTVDHVEGYLKKGYDAFDAFLSHMWAVTLMGAPKKKASVLIENMENSARGWYGGAVGAISFNGDANTGITIRTVFLENNKAYYRAGASLVYDSDGLDEALETKIKANAFFSLLSDDKNASDENIYSELKKIGKNKKLVVIDCEDSFVNCLSGYFSKVGMEVKTYHYSINLEDILKKEKPDLVLLSPGPGIPSDFNLDNKIKILTKKEIPTFGVCLGLQALYEAFGGKLTLLKTPRQGKKWEVHHNKKTIFNGLENPFNVGAYHSIIADKNTLPKELEIIAQNEKNMIMAIKHKTLPLYAVQFHPESIMSMEDNAGLMIIKNLLKEVLS